MSQKRSTTTTVRVQDRSRFAEEPATERKLRPSANRGPIRSSQGGVRGGVSLPLPPRASHGYGLWVIESRDVYANAIFLSLLLHLLSFWGMNHLPRTTVPSSTPVEVVYRDETPTDRRSQKTMVPDVTVPPSEQVEANDDMTPFLASKSQRVRQQMRAEKTGPAQNSFSPASLTKQDVWKSLAQSNPTQDRDVPTADEGEVALNRPRKDDLAMARALRSQESSFNAILPREIPVGNATVLNTDYHLFASFYNRYLQLIHYRWYKHLRGNIQRAQSRGTNLPAPGEYRTVAEITLDRAGYIQKIEILGRAGWDGFDDAVVNGNREIPQVPNPPVEMVESDGKIRIRIAYLLYFHNR